MIGDGPRPSCADCMATAERTQRLCQPVSDVAVLRFGTGCRIWDVRIDIYVTGKRFITRSDEDAMTTTLLVRPTTTADHAFAETQRDELLDQLSPRELEVLALMAEGRSNRAIGEQLAVGLKTVETHVSRVFTKLALNEDRYENRRVLAVLTFLGRDNRDVAPVHSRA